MKLLATLSTFVALCAPLPAAIIISGNVSTPGAPCTLTITADIVSEITTEPEGYLAFLVLDDWVEVDGQQNFITLNEQLACTVNVGPTLHLDSMLADNWDGAVLPDMNAGDGYLYVSIDPILQVGDTFTVKAGTYSFSGAAGMNPQIVGTFGGNFFVADERAVRIGEITNLSVPEPSAALLGAVVSLPLLRRRRC